MLWLFRLVLAALVGALVYDMYSPSVINVELDPYVYLIVGALVLVEPAFWITTHLAGGIMMGLASGGFWDGLKLSLILGFGLGASRLWPHVLAAAAGVYAGGGPGLYSYGGALLAALLFGLEKMMVWLWNFSPMEQHNNNH